MPAPTPDQLRAWDKAFLDGLLYGVYSPYFVHLDQSENENHIMHQAQQMTDDLPNLTILIKLLKMTTSSNDGEALNAIRMANSALAKFGGDWERLLRGKVTVIGADPFERIPDPPRYTSPKPQPQPKPQPRPAPPPPPRQPSTHTSISQCSLIENYFDVLEFVTGLDSAVQANINRIQQDYKNNKRLNNVGSILLADFAFLEALAKAHTRKPRRGRP